MGYVLHHLSFHHYLTFLRPLSPSILFSHPIVPCVILLVLLPSYLPSLCPTTSISSLLPVTLAPCSSNQHPSHHFLRISNFLCSSLSPFFSFPFLCSSLCPQATVTINNLAPRLDVQGQIMDAHDGSIQRFTINNQSLYCIYFHFLSLHISCFIFYTLHHTYLLYILSFLILF